MLVVEEGGLIYRLVSQAVKTALIVYLAGHG